MMTQCFISGGYHGGYGGGGGGGGNAGGGPFGPGGQRFTGQPHSLMGLTPRVSTQLTFDLFYHFICYKAELRMNNLSDYCEV